MNTYKSMHHQIPAFNLQKIPFPIPWVQATVHISSCVCSEKMVARTFLEAVDKVKAAEGSAPKMTQPIETTKKRLTPFILIITHDFTSKKWSSIFCTLIFNWRIYVMKALQRRLLIPWGRVGFLMLSPHPPSSNPPCPVSDIGCTWALPPPVWLAINKNQTWRSYC